MLWSNGSGRGDFPFEFLHSSGRIYGFFFAGVERVAGIANFHVYFFKRGADFKMVAAGAFNGRFIVLWMNICFHMVDMLLYKQALVNS